MSRREIETVRWFGDGPMLEKLLTNKHKGDWRMCSQNYLLRMLKYEVEELQEAMIAGTLDGGGAAAIIEEAADVANFAMMIADNVCTFCNLPKEESPDEN